MKFQRSICFCFSTLQFSFRQNLSIDREQEETKSNKLFRNGWLVLRLNEFYISILSKTLTLNSRRQESLRRFEFILSIWFNFLLYKYRGENVQSERDQTEKKSEDFSKLENNRSNKDWNSGLFSNVEWYLRFCLTIGCSARLTTALIEFLG